MAVNPKQSTLDSFVKKASSSPRTQRVQSGPIRHAAASKIVRHSPMSKPEGSSVEGVHTGSHTGTHKHTMPTQQSMAIEAATSSSHPPSSATVSLKAASTSRKLQLSEVKGDLFSCPDSASLVHCVSEDLHMGKGIATLFKQKFGGVGELKSQGIKTGGLAVLKREDRFIYYLVTKVRYFHKPTYDTLSSSLRALRDHCVSSGVRELCMPRIGCGLDKLKWDRVVAMIREVFADMDMAITVYYL